MPQQRYTTAMDERQESTPKQHHLAQHLFSPGTAIVHQ
jgi:hypothetical protein